MPAAARSSATAVFELKSAALTLLAVSVKTADLAVLAASLQERFGDTPGMFEHDPVVIDITLLRDDDAAIDFAALAALLRAQGMVPVAVKGGSPLQMAAALQAGLAEAPEGLAPVRQQPAVAEAAPAPAPAPAPAFAPAVAAVAEAPANADGSRAEHSVADSAGASATDDPAADAAATPAAAAAVLSSVSPAPTRIVDRPLRSGQQVYARQADLVVMAVVSFGAEVIADGHIHVYGPLRGRAIAGAKGDTSARIFSTCMEPQLVSIAGVYRTIDTELPANVLGKPAQVRLDGDRLVVEPLVG